jgi:hypothetical protein
MSTALLAAIFAVVGILAVIGVSYAFYLVGRSEDRDREAAQPPEPEGEADHHQPGTARERRRPMPPRRPEA